MRLCQKGTRKRGKNEVKYDTAKIIKMFLKTFQIALIGWIKAGPPKKPLLF